MNNYLDLIFVKARNAFHRLLRFLLKVRYGDPASVIEQNNDVVSQVHLMQYYRHLAGNSPEDLPDFRDVGFRRFSQTDEDGRLLFLFSVYGTVNKKLLEVCCGDGIECNSANLILRHGWTGLLMDGNGKKIDKGKFFYATSKETTIFPPRLINAWINRENINKLVADNGLSGEIDLFSLDMDGVDYWIWDALTVVRPRIVVVEYQSLWGPDASVTVPYRADFVRSRTHPEYFGASLNAFVQLARKKGYRLVGCNRYCFNAFFVRDDLPHIVASVSPDDCFFHPKVDISLRRTYMEQMQKLEWVGL